MSELVYIPLACKKDDGMFQGQVKLRMPNVTERYRYISKLGFKANDEGKMEVSQSEMIEKIPEMIEMSKPHYVSVDIKYTDGTASYKSFDELNSDSNCEEMLIEIASKVLEGFRPSKNS